MKHLRKYFSLVLLVLFISGCSAAPNTYTGISYFYDITPNDDAVVFTYFEKNKGTIYEYDMKKETTRKIKEEKDLSLTSITLSNNGEKIFALAQSKNQAAPKMVYEIDRKTGSSKKIYETNGKDAFITGITQSKDEENVYVMQSSSYEEKEPIKGKLPHGFDIYKVSLANNSSEKITNMNAYIAENISYDPSTDSLLFSSYNETIDENATKSENDKEATAIYSSKIYSYSLATNEMKQVHMDVNEKSATKDLYTPDVSNNGKYIAFTGATKIKEDNSLEYEVFLKDLQSGEISIPTKTKEAYGPVFFNKSDKIFFSDRETKDEKASYHIYDIKTKKTKKVTITIK